MAGNESNEPPGDGKGGDNIAIEARRVVAEVTVILDSVAGGLEALQRLPEAILVRPQIGVLRDLVTLAAQTVEAFAETLGRTA
jgi:hypothetical protein